MPVDFEQIELIKFEKVFIRDTGSVKLTKQHKQVKLSMVGEGSYAHVYSYVDREYGIKPSAPSRRVPWPGSSRSSMS